MAVVGHTAASMNVYLDIPTFLRGVSQSLLYSEGPDICISTRMLEEPDPTDPTAIFDEYLSDWWNFHKEWETHPVEVDLEEAFRWHVEKVRGSFILGQTQC